MNKKTLGFCTLLIPALATAAINKDNTDLKAKYSFGGHTIDGNIDTARILSTKIGLGFEHRYTDYFRFNFEGGVTLQTGTYERNALGGSGPTPANYLSLKESTITLSPTSFIEIKAGAINQRELSSPLLLTSAAFLASKEVMTIGKESYGIKLFAEQAYAKNKDLTSTLPEAEEGLPKFFAEGAELYLKSDIFDLSVHGMHWAYDKLGAGIATEGAFRGNTPIGSGAGGFTGFKYKYIGWYAGIRTEFKLINDHKIMLNGDYVINDEAPDSLNNGYRVEGAFAYNHEKGYLTIGANYHEIKSDATPAYYATFQNNKTCYGGYISWNDEKEPFEIKFSAAHYEEIVNNTYQSPENRVFFNISSSYNFL